MPADIQTDRFSQSTFSVPVPVVSHNLESVSHLGTGLGAPKRILEKTTVALLNLANGERPRSGKSTAAYVLDRPIQTSQCGGIGYAPYAALLRALVEADELRSARALMALVPKDGRATQTLMTIFRLLTPPTVRTVAQVDGDRAADYRWLKEHSHEYKGQWVAIHLGELLRIAPTLRELKAELQELAPRVRPLIHHIE